MGINSLLLNLRSITSKKHISDYSGQTAGIDGYSWLHKALYSYNIKEDMQNNLMKFVRYFSKRIAALIKHKVTPLVVFDGDKLPLKRRTEDAEYKARKKNYEDAMEAYKLGNKEEAKRLFMEAITVTPEMAHFVMQKLKETFNDKVSFIVAPYEADSQLAYLNKINRIQFVITEDSDLLVFGAKVVFYKMDKEFNGDEIKLDNLNKATEADLSNFSHDMFIHLCILTGCDYLDSPRGIGFKRAYKLLSVHKTIEKVIEQIKDKLQPGYYIQFLSAYLGFKYQRVFCPIKNKLVSLNDMNLSDTSNQQSFDTYAAKKCYLFWGNFDFLGKIYDNTTAKKIAYCEVDPITKESFISGCNTMYNYKFGRNGKSSKKKEENDQEQLNRHEKEDGLVDWGIIDKYGGKNEQLTANPFDGLRRMYGKEIEDHLSKYRYEEVKGALFNNRSLIELMEHLNIKSEP